MYIELFKHLEILVMDVSQGVPLYFSFVSQLYHKIIQVNYTVKNLSLLKSPSFESSRTS